jgi:hypothetical protein
LMMTSCAQAVNGREADRLRGAASRTGAVGDVAADLRELPPP